MYLDYNLKTSAERINHVQKILSSGEPVSKSFLEYAADYILFMREGGQTKSEKNAEHPMQTANRATTVSKRETSLEQIVLSLENGEDGLYALINNDKNQLLDRKEKIEESQYEKNPLLTEKRKQIESLTAQFKETPKGKKRYLLKKQIIETGQELYILRAATKTGAAASHGKVPSSLLFNSLPENITIDKNGMPQSDCKINLLNPAHVSFLLCNYSQLREETYDNLNSDMHWLIVDLENLIERAFRKEGLEDSFLYDLLVWKIDGLSNEEIKERMIVEHNEYHNEQYYSSLGRQRIPKMIANQYRKDILVWYYSNVAYGEWKQCSHCGQWKPAHGLFFSKNTSKDGWYSICKDCRKRKKLK